MDDTPNRTHNDKRKLQLWNFLRIVANTLIGVLAYFFVQLPYSFGF